MKNPEERAEQLYNMFKTVLKIQDMRIGKNEFVQGCVSALCDTMKNEFTGNKEKIDYWNQVKNASVLNDG